VKRLQTTNFVCIALNIAELHKSETLPNFDEMKEGRRNAKTYRLFCEKFVHKVIGPQTYKNGCFSKRFQDYCQPGDEALTFLILANNWALWLEQAESPFLENGKKRTSAQCTSKQKYFVEGKGRGHSWNNEGKEYYNTMYKLVEKDRAEYGDLFDSELLDIMQNGVENEKQRRLKKRRDKKMGEREERVVCHNDYGRKRMSA
jgi:hypothetical protein